MVGSSWANTDSSGTVPDKLVVEGKRSQVSERIAVEKEETRTGLTDDIDKLLVLKPGVTGVPEAGSSLLVHGESPLDNKFLLYGVPMFAPSHFSNSTFCDHSATMISTVNEVRIVTDELGGRFSGASGSVIACDPGVCRLADPRLIPRPELSVGIGALCQDFSLSFPARKGADIYQLSFTNTDAYRISFQGVEQLSSQQAALGYGMPATFGDLVYTGAHAWGKFALREYALYAYDKYKPSIQGDGMTVPWGVGGLIAEDTLANGILKVSAGGSRQQYYEGKKYGLIIPLVHAERTNGILSASLYRVKSGASLYDAAVQVEGLDWQGEQTIRGNTGPDSAKIIASPFTKAETGKEAEVTLHGGAQRGFGRTGVGANVLLGCIAPWYRAYADPGLWARLELDRWSAGVCAGITTTRPDIRGLPTHDYRGTLQKTYSVSVNGQAAPVRWLDAGADAYVKRKDRCAALSLEPGNLVWDPSVESPVLTEGINTTLALSPVEHWTLTMLQDFARANRMYPGGRQLYEWNVPWSQKSILRYSVLSDRLQFFLIGIFSAGLPYRDVVRQDSSVTLSSDFSRDSTYKRIDFKVQVNQNIKDNRLLTRYDCYVEVTNIADWTNIREYYWDSNMEKLPVFLDRLGINLGVRLGFRF